MCQARRTEALEGSSLLSSALPSGLEPTGCPLTRPRSRGGTLSPTWCLAAAESGWGEGWGEGTAPRFMESNVAGCNSAMASGDSRPTPFAVPLEVCSPTPWRSGLLFALPTRKRCPPSAFGPLSPAGRSGTLQDLEHPMHGGLRGFAAYTLANCRQASAITDSAITDKRNHGQRAAAGGAGAGSSRSGRFSMSLPLALLQPPQAQAKPCNLFGFERSMICELYRNSKERRGGAAAGRETARRGSGGGRAARAGDR